MLETLDEGIVASPSLPRGFLGPGDDPKRRVYVCPRLAVGAPVPSFTHVDVLARGALGVTVTLAGVDEVKAWAWSEGEDLGAHVGRTIEHLRMRRPPFAGLALGRPRVIGVVNVTPDSFSDGGETFDAEAAVRRGLQFLAAGADILDVGGESTRPGALPVSESEEAARAVPVVRRLVREGARVSIDSRHAGVIEAALDAGAAIINDVTALAGDPKSLALAARRGADVVLMHMRGEPSTMQAAPRYEHAALDVYDDLAARVAACEAAGIPRHRIAVDPGIGFGKTVGHNLVVLNRLALFLGLGTAVALGVSRKSFIGRLSRDEPPQQRVPGSLAAALAGVLRGAHVVRVHDVAETRQALAVWEAIAAADAAAATGAAPTA